MNTEQESGGSPPDPAAVLGAAVSLWQACQRDPRPNLSACYGDGTEWMREVMRVATLFESWATRHVCFDEFDECWPYFLEDSFGEACAALIGVDGLARFDAADCLRVALRLRLPVICSERLVVPIDITVANPVPGPGFTAYRIQSMRCLSVEDGVVPLTHADELLDTENGPPFFALDGLGEDGLLEHIADRRSYAEARELACKLVPGLAFPEVAVASYPNYGDSAGPASAARLLGAR